MSVIVSIIIPVRNEEKYIKQCLDSVLNQDFPKEDIEIILVDGMSTDRTREILQDYINKFDFIKLLDNVNKTVPYAMNLGIEHSTGKYIIRLDAHSYFPPDYIRKCVELLDTIDADVVGGLAVTAGRTKIGKVIAKLLSSPFGVGNSRFRIFSKSGYVDTVPFGAFRREVFDKYGKYDTRLNRSEDYELNHRIRKNGGKIYLSDEIKFTYFCRDSIKGIMKQGYQNGKWIVRASKLIPGSMALRHFIPLLFVLSLIVGLSILFTNFTILKILFSFELFAYALLNIFFSLKQSKFRITYFFWLLILHPLFHISYGIGSIISVFNLLKKEESIK